MYTVAAEPVKARYQYSSEIRYGFRPFFGGGYMFYSHKHQIKLCSNMSIINYINNFKSCLFSTGPGPRVILLSPRFK